MRLECWWSHSQKRWAENLEDFEKGSVEVRPWCWEVEVRHGVQKLRIWDWTMQADNWSSAIGAENGVLCHRVEFSTVAAAHKCFGSRQAKINWDLEHVGDVVSIVWLQKTFTNCVSLLVSKNWSQKLINRSYLNHRVRLLWFVFSVLELWLRYLWLRVLYNTHTHTHIYIYIYIYIDRERQRERQRKRQKYGWEGKLDVIQINDINLIPIVLCLLSEICLHFYPGLLTISCELRLKCLWNFIAFNDFYLNEISY